MRSMRIATATVRQGRVELPAEFVGEGEQVMIVAPDAGEPICLTPAEESEISEAVEQIRRGEFIDGETLLNELRLQNLG